MVGLRSGSSIERKRRDQMFYFKTTVQLCLLGCLLTQRMETVLIYTYKSTISIFDQFTRENKILNDVNLCEGRSYVLISIIFEVYIFVCLHSAIYYFEIMYWYQLTLFTRTLLMTVIRIYMSRIIRFFTSDIKEFKCEYRSFVVE